MILPIRQGQERDGKEKAPIPLKIKGGIGGMCSFFQKSWMNAFCSAVRDLFLFQIR